MEIRKVQITGKSTFVVSLPKKWVNSICLRSGDSIGLIPLPDGNLLVNPKINSPDKDQLKKVIQVENDNSDQLFRKFVAAYLAGYAIIEFKINGSGTYVKEIKQDIRGFSHDLIGPQLVEETSSSMTLRDLLDSSDFSLVKGVKRMYMITREMHIEAMNLLRTHGEESANEIMSRDREVDKLNWMIAKQYNLIIKDVYFADKMGVQPLEALGYMKVARTLERVADHASRIATNSIKVRDNDQLVSKLLQMDAEIVKLMDEAMSAFYSRKIEMADQVVGRSKLMVHSIDNLANEIQLQNAGPGSIINMAFLVDSLERTSAYVSDIAETAIDHCYIIEYNSSNQPAIN